MRHGHRFRLIVSHIDEGQAGILVKFRDFLAHLDPQLGIEIGQGLIHQEELGMAYESPAKRNSLTLSAGQFSRAPVQEMIDPQLFGDGFDLGGHDRPD